MNLDHLKTDNGFFTKMDFIQRISRNKPPANGHYTFKQLKGTSFSEVLVNGIVAKSLFKIYTGNKKLYNYIEETFYDAANLIGFKVESEK